MLPDNELATFLLTVEDAVDLARDGNAPDGYQMLLAGLHRARGIEGKPWAEELIEPYSQAVERYAEMYGIGRA